MSLPSLNVDRKLIIEIGSDEKKMFVFIGTCNGFAHFAPILVTQSCLVNSSLKRGALFSRACQKLFSVQNTLGSSSFEW